jgi:enamine deaminase RidA (YjgF/YER057c/UK114 family)
MKRTNLSSGSKWEEIVGYSRAVKVGNTIELSGTVASDNSGEVVGDGDFYLQTKFILMKIENTLNQLGAKMSDIVRTRVYTTDITQWEKIGKAHGEVFGEIKPASTMIGISGFVDEKYLVEIEVTAIILD